MSHYGKYMGKVEFTAGGEAFAFDFTMDDRIKLAVAYEKSGGARIRELADLAVALIMRVEPGENKQEIEAFLIKNNNIEEFCINLMIAAGLAKKDDFEKAIADAREKKERDR